MIFLYNLFYMFYTYGLHPNFVFTKYGRDNKTRDMLHKHHTYARASLKT
jgi:hypothetical protein